ncbi:MAG: selenocysteine-specific elongation factor [Actinomycetota bacterium]|jgi:selenocysteine-specific elongation factor
MSNAEHADDVMTRVVATAGHVDHGKSSLVRALTGTDPDRFEEEKRRGLTIDLGFAHTLLADDVGVSFVDVPGHTRFVRNMLAGVGAVETCLFVVAATEGWKPQTEEHLRILELLGMRHGVIALTKSDLVDDEWREIVELEIADRVSGTFLEAAPLVAVSSVTGSGLEALRNELASMLRAAPSPADNARPRLWIDRVFAARGSGTVVTGTLTGGPLASGDQVEVLTERGVLPVRVRAIQTLGRAVNEIGPGHRVALNLSGVEHSDLARGDVVIVHARWRPSRRVDASLTVLASIDHDVSRRGAYVAYIGSGEFPVRLRVLGPDAITPASTGNVRLHLSREVALLPGDRFVLRESGRNETVGGGEILDVAPIRSAARARPDRSVDRVIAERRWVHVDELEALTGERRTPTLGSWVTAPGEVDDVVAALVARVTAAPAPGLDLAALDERQRAALALATSLEVADGYVRPVAERDELADHPFIAAARSGGFAPPAPEGIDRGVLRALVRRGMLVERDGIFFHIDAIDTASRIAADLLREHPGGFTVAQFRDATGASRKYVLPLVGELDARGVTRRRDDLRIGGPRLPTA